MENEETIFYCPDGGKEFKAIGYRNANGAGFVANCPTCGEACQEKTVKIPISTYKRLREVQRLLMSAYPIQKGDDGEYDYATLVFRVGEATSVIAKALGEEKHDDEREY